MALFPSVNVSDIKPNYTSEEISWALEQGDVHEGPWIYIGQRLLLPQASQWKFLKLCMTPSTLEEMLQYQWLTNYS